MQARHALHGPLGRAYNREVHLRAGVEIMPCCADYADGLRRCLNAGRRLIYCVSEGMCGRSCDSLGGLSGAHEPRAAISVGASLSPRHRCVGLQCL